MKIEALGEKEETANTAVINEKGGGGLFAATSRGEEVAELLKGANLRLIGVKWGRSEETLGHKKNSSEE